MRHDEAYGDTLLQIAQEARALGLPFDPDEERRQLLAVGALHHAWDRQGLSMFLTLAPTVFGDQPRQTMMLETATGTWHCICDGGMTAGVQAIYFDDYLRLRGIIQ